MSENVMFDYIPGFFLNADNFKLLVDISSKQFNKMDGIISDIIDQLYVDTATWGLIYWEAEYGLDTSESLTYEERRSRIKGKIRSKGKVGRSLIQNIAEAYVNGTVDVTFDNAMIVRFVNENGIPSNIEDLKKQIEDVKPFHIPLFFRYKYITYQEWQKITWAESQATTYADIINI